MLTFSVTKPLSSPHLCNCSSKNRPVYLSRFACRNAARSFGAAGMYYWSIGGITRQARVGDRKPTFILPEVSVRSTADTAARKSGGSRQAPPHDTPGPELQNGALRCRRSAAHSRPDPCRSPPWTPSWSGRRRTTQLPDRSMLGSKGRCSNRHSSRAILGGRFADEPARETAAMPVPPGPPFSARFV